MGDPKVNFTFTESIEDRADLFHIVVQLYSKVEPHLMDDEKDQIDAVMKRVQDRNRGHAHEGRQL